MVKIHRTNKTDDWLTPPELVSSLGEFDLDPCSSLRQSGQLAKRCYRLPDDNGLLLPWEGRVWCNPPFSQMASWVHKFVLHANGVMICPLRMQVRWSQTLFDHADAIKFIREPVRWISRDGNSQLGDLFDFMLISIGPDSKWILSRSLYKGIVWDRPIPLVR